MPFPLNHDLYMRMAISAARQNPRAPFGALVVRIADGNVLATGVNHTSDGPHWHGEMDAIDQASRAHPQLDWRGCVLYTTAEPCPMCQSTILWSGLAGVIYGASIPFLTMLGWSQIDIRAAEVIARSPFATCELIDGVLTEDCEALFKAIG